MNKNLDKKQKNILLLLILGLILIDQIIKIFMTISNVQNISDVGWGIGLEKDVTLDNNITYILISFIAIMFLIKYIRSNNSYIKMNSKVILSFAIAGVASNLIDRILKGYVLNYIYIPNFPSLNFAYIYIIITWIGLAVILTKYTINQRNESKYGKRK